MRHSQKVLISCICARVNANLLNVKRKPVYSQLFMGASAMERFHWKWEKHLERKVEDEKAASDASYRRRLRLK